MEGRRQSERIKKSVRLGGGVKQPKDRRTPRQRVRDSVGEVLGLTPNRPKGRNLDVTHASDAAAATAVKLNGLEMVEQSVRKQKGKKEQHHDIYHTHRSYSPVTRDSIAMYSTTS